MPNIINQEIILQDLIIEFLPKGDSVNKDLIYLKI
jgi:hypothetical protein